MGAQAAIGPYLARLERWFPGLHVTDAALTGLRGRTRVRYAIALRPHLAHQDAALVAAEVQRVHGHRPARAAAHRRLVLAPYVRPAQGAVLQHAGVDYVDLAGNAHLEAPGIFVHVEGVRPPRTAPPARARFTRGWVKTVMALLIRPDLVRGPYRPLANAADVALGTLTACLRDLRARGLLHGEGERRALHDRPQLVALWVAAYVDVLRPRLAERRFQTKTTTKADVWQRMQAAFGARQIGWVLTGADAAEQVTRYFRTDETEVYAPVAALDDRALLRELDAQPALRGNLRVVEPPGPLAVGRPAADAGVPVAPLLLVYAELRHRGGDQAEEAAALLLPKLVADAAA